MSATAHENRPVHPIELIRSAVLSQRASGIYIRIGALGVHCTSQEPPAWERDPRVTGCSPLGAVLLEYVGPGTVEPHDALAEIFDCRRAFVDGLADGMDKVEPDSSRAASLADGRNYIAGWEVGYRFREEFLRGGFAS